MDQRKLLIILMFLLLICGGLALGRALLQAMAPDKVSTERHRVEVKLADIPARGFYSINYRNFKAFIGKQPKLQVFLMPFTNHADEDIDTYYLPDPGWDRPFIPCRQFQVSSQGFACTDPQLHQSWHRQARWDANGNNLGSRMPDLQQARFKVEAGVLILSPQLGSATPRG